MVEHLATKEKVCFHVVAPCGNKTERSKKSVYSLRFLSFSICVATWISSYLWKTDSDNFRCSSFGSLSAEVVNDRLRQQQCPLMALCPWQLFSVAEERWQLTRAHRGLGLHNLRVQPSWALQLRCYRPVNWQNRWASQRRASKSRVIQTIQIRHRRRRNIY